MQVIKGYLMFMCTWYELLFYVMNFPVSQFNLYLDVGSCPQCMWEHIVAACAGTPSTVYTAELTKSSYTIYARYLLQNVTISLCPLTVPKIRPTG